MEQTIKSNHQFFERYLDNDLNSLTKYLDNKYEDMKKINWINKEYPYDPGSHWLSFNIFMFYHEGIHNIYKEVRDMTKEACSYYNIDFDSKKYYITGWFNYYAQKMNVGCDPDKLNYHDHSNDPSEFHGYYCLNAEPSTTHYKINGERFDNINKNNRAILSQNGFAHAAGEWNQDSNRITIAYNCIPFERLNPDIAKCGQYIPL